MPTIQDEEISLAVCDAAGWTVLAQCVPCRLLVNVPLEPLRNWPMYRRALVHVLGDSKVHFRCTRCLEPAASLHITRRGPGRKVAVLKATHSPGVR